MSKLTNAEKDKLDNTCGNLRVTKLGTHVKTLEDFVNEGVLDTRANTVVEAINELYGMIVNKDCEGITIPPPGFFTLFGNDEDGKLYCYYNDKDHPPLFRHVETPGELEGTLYLYIADPEGDNHFEMEIGHYIAVRHLDNYYTKSQCDAKYPVTVEKQSTATSGYAATYVVKQNGSQVGTKIDIPKDFFLKGGSVKTCTTANNPVQGYAVGDKYLDMEINVQDGTATTKHMYILLRDLAPLYSADESTLTLSSNNVFSVKNGGISSVKIANGAVTTDKIASSAVTNDKINYVNGSKVIDSNAHSNIGSSANANQNAINTAIDTKISKLATKEQVDKIIAGDIDLTGYLKDDVGTVKSSNIADGTIVNGDIANTTITGGKLVNGTITATQLASNAVSTEKVSSIGAEKITNTRRLTTEDNLDNLTSTGRYYADATTMKTITNNVFQIACIIEVVLWGTSNNLVLQRMYRISGTSQASNTIYYRVRHDAGWFDWQKISVDGHNHDNLYLQKISGVSQNSNGNITLPTDYQSTTGATGNIPISSNIVKDTQSLTDALPTLKTLIGSIKDSNAKWWDIISARHRNGSNDGNMFGLYLKSLLTGDGDLIWNKQYKDSSTQTDTWIGERTILDSNNCKNYATKPLMTRINATSDNHKSLNDFTTAGFYYCGNDNTEAPYIKRTPLNDGDSTPYSTNSSFFMLVETWNSANYLKQTVTYYQTGDTYIRTRTSSSTWNAWKLQLSEENYGNHVASKSHAHGYISSDGYMGDNAYAPIITNANGKMVAGAFGTAEHTVCEGNDSRLSDSRTPKSHTHGYLTNDGKLGTEAGKPIITCTDGKICAGSFGTSAKTFCEGNDSRITNAVKSACKIGFSTSSSAPGDAMNLSVAKGDPLYAFVRDANGNVPTGLAGGAFLFNGSPRSVTINSNGIMSLNMNTVGTFIIHAIVSDGDGYQVAAGFCRITVS